MRGEVLSYILGGLVGDRASREGIVMVVGINEYCTECHYRLIVHSKFCSSCGIYIPQKPSEPKPTPKPKKVKEPRPILFSLSEEWVNDSTVIAITILSLIAFVILGIIVEFAGADDPYYLGTGGRDWGVLFWFGFGFFSCAIVRLLKQEFSIAFFAFASLGGLMLFWSLEEFVRYSGPGPEIGLLIAGIVIGLLLTYILGQRNAK